MSHFRTSVPFREQQVILQLMSKNPQKHFITKLRELEDGQTIKSSVKKTTKNEKKHFYDKKSPKK